MSEIGDALRELAGLLDRMPSGVVPRVDVDIRAHSKTAGRRLMQLARQLKTPGRLNGGRTESYSWQCLERRVSFGHIQLTWYNGALDPIIWGFFGKPLGIEEKAWVASDSPLLTE